MRHLPPLGNLPRTSDAPTCSPGKPLPQPRLLCMLTGLFVPTLSHNFTWESLIQIFSLVFTKMPHLGANVGVVNECMSE